MKFFEKRKWKKAIHHLLHESRHARHMREDIADPKLIEQVVTAEKALTTAWDEGRGVEELDRCADNLNDLYSDLYPMGGQAPGREMVEVIVVALVVAMALRAYFIQPFKIPTGSMQPTLNGILYQPVSEGPNWSDRLYPVRIAKFIVMGKSYKQWKAKHTCQVVNLNQRRDGQFEMQFSVGPSMVIPGQVNLLKVTPGAYVNEGDVVAAGWKMAGDHIFVDKVRYNFLKPKLGQVFVFNTSGIKHSQIKPNNYYIKRLCGLPGNTVSLEPPHLVINDEKIEEPYPFYRVVHHQDEGYNGYVYASRGTETVLDRPGNSITLADNEYLPMGDNSRSSLDGRYFGAVKEDTVVGPAFLVYWPFGSHWGLIR